MTVIEAITKGTEFLQRKQIESPRLQTELLLAHILNLPRLRLYLEFERPLMEAQSNTLRDLLVQRSNHVPLQHLTGSASFCGCPILVSRAVLIPRPETEMLAEAAWLFLKSLQRETNFLDVGTGSGCIPIAIAAHEPGARGVAIDLSKEALAVAAENVAKNQLSARIELRESDLFSGVTEKFDAIVSNPPYIPSSEIETLDPEVRDHDPRSALDGGADGLDFYRLIAAQAPAFLKADARIFLEFGDGQGPALASLFEAEGWKVEKIVADLSKRDRILIASRSAGN